MKFTLNWLKRHLDTAADAAAVADALTRIGLEVEGVEDRGAKLAPFLVGYVVSAEKHPNADRLKVCLVDTGTDKVQVICGAPNARTGMKGVFARAGSTIPRTGAELKAGVIRGVESNGMLCSAFEMGLSDDHEGIIDLPADAPVGRPFAQFMGLDDPIFEIAVTPNKADCLGVRGIARDLAAAGLGTLKPFDTAPVLGRYPCPTRWRIAPGAESACPYVVGRTVRGLKNGPSPSWLQERLTAIGLRPISALVDITNLTTFDFARPLHVFDAGKLSGDMTMRFARAGERLAALNGRTYDLAPSMLVIADDKSVHGIAGIMGGEETGCSATTTSVFIESALFDRGAVARTGRALNIVSDARYRFERGIDPTSPLWGCEAATRLILEICGGEAGELTVAGGVPAWQRQIDYRWRRTATLAGIDIDPREQRRILLSLGFAVEGDGERVKVAPPAWRADVEGEADLVEEVTRINGFDRIEARSLTSPGAVPATAVTGGLRRSIVAKRMLAERGLMEAVTFSFMPASQAELFGNVKDELKLLNPISADLDAMRPSILPNLLAAVRRNLDRGVKDPALFEVGPQYADASPNGQALVAASIRSGSAGPRHWLETARPVDAYDAKADAMAVLEVLGAPIENLQVTTDAPAWYHPGQAASLRLGPNVLAWFGAVHPKVLTVFDIRLPVVAVEVFLDRIPEPKRKETARPPLKLSPFQPVERDFAFVLDAGIAAEAVMRAVRAADKALIAEVRIFDRYEGDKVGPGKKSLAFAVALQPTDATLTDEQIEAVSAKIVAAVAKATGGTLRK
jgi:phenylalanyl-tRNA synthetase beta chain